MYKYVENDEFLKKLRTTCGDIVNRLKMSINRDKKMTVHCEMVGSGKRRMITQNENEPVDLDYNLWIDDIVAFKINQGQKIKDYVMQKFNEVLKEYEIRNSYVKDSTSAITTELLNFTKGNKTEFSIDLAITAKCDGSWYRLIHKKTERRDTNEWYWNEGRNSKNLDQKIDKIKKRSLWNEVRNSYLAKKNMYLSRNDYNHPSFICFIEAVNEVYDKHFGQE